MLKNWNEDFRLKRNIRICKMAQQIFDIGGNQIWTKHTTKSQRQKIPSTIKISRTTTKQNIVSKEVQNPPSENRRVKYVRPDMNILAAMSSPSVFASEVGGGGSREKVPMIVMC